MSKKSWFGKKKAHEASKHLRTRAEVQDEYNRACNEAGDLQYKIVAMGQRIEFLTELRGRLNEEMVAIERAELAEAAKNAPKAPPAPEEPEASPPGNA